MIKKPGIIYPYLGYNEELLDSRRTGRCAQTVDPGGDGERPASLTQGAVSSYSTALGGPRVARLDNSRFIVVFRNTTPNRLEAMVCQVESDLSITRGAASIVFNGLASAHVIDAIDTNKVLVVYRDNSADQVKAHILTSNSGLTFTDGGSNTLFNGGFSEPSVAEMQTNVAALLYRDTTAGLLRRVTVSGATVAVSSTTTATSSTSGGELKRINNTQVVGLYNASGLKANVFSDNGSGFDQGTPYALSGWNANLALGNTSAAVNNAGTLISISARLNSTAATVLGTVLTPSGTTLARDARADYTSASSSTLGHLHSVSVNSSNLHVVVFNHNGSGSERVPLLEAYTAGGTSLSLRHARTQLSSFPVSSSIHSVKMSNNKLVWVAASSTSSSTGPILIQALNIV